MNTRLKAIEGSMESLCIHSTSSNKILEEIVDSQKAIEEKMTQSISIQERPPPLTSVSRSNSVSSMGSLAKVGTMGIITLAKLFYSAGVAGDSTYLRVISKKSNVLSAFILLSGDDSTTLPNVATAIEKILNDK